MNNEESPTIIIKKIKKVSGGHHGGAWKVAYADFVTAMMAFFLLLWLLNVTTDEQKELISSYFDPSDVRIADNNSGSGGLLGGLSVADRGQMPKNAEPLVGQPGSPAGQGKTSPHSTLYKANDQPDSDGKGDGQGEGEGKSELEKEVEKIKAEMEAIEGERFSKAERELKQAIESMPELQALADSLLIDQTPEGLRIQIVDQKGRPMFQSGKTSPLPDAQKLLTLIAKTIATLPNLISIRGHTDSKPYGKGSKYTNWDLSADRANASRKFLLDGGLDIKRIENIMGKADREHLLPKTPLSPRNRRISIVLLKETKTKSISEIKKEIDADKKKKEAQKSKQKSESKSKSTKPKKVVIKPSIRKQEEGIIYFP